MSALEQIQRLWQHAVWADDALLDALRQAADPPSAAVREYAHVLGAEEVWLARLERRAPGAAVWPELTLAGAAELAGVVREGYDRYLATLRDEELATAISYTNSAGQAFATPVGDLLLHVALHGQYHRGKVNLLLRQAGHTPAPADFIAFARGVPAATGAAAQAAGGRSPSASATRSPA